jgi:hypothetical protein
MMDCTEGRFNLIAAVNTLPVLGRKIIRCQQSALIPL